MKTVALPLMLLALTLVACGEAPDVSFTTGDGRVTIDLPAGWYENPQSTAYDLHAISPNGQMVTGLFVYDREGMDAPMAGEQLYQFHIDDMQSKRANFTVLEARETVNQAGKSLTRTVFSGENPSGDTDYYTFTLIEFDGQPDVTVVALQVAVPDRWAHYKPTLEKIVHSARLSE